MICARCGHNPGELELRSVDIEPTPALADRLETVDDYQWAADRFVLCAPCVDELMLWIGR